MAIDTDSRRAARLVARAYGLSPPRGITEVARGAMGKVWRLSTDDAAYALKELFWTSRDEFAAGIGETEVREEVAFREAAMAVGIRAPIDLRTIDGRYLHMLPATLA